MQPLPLRLLNIAPLLDSHQDELVADIADLHAKDVITENAFIMTLVPESDPPVDKAAVLGRRFAPLHEALKARGVPSGILVQATMGHGWTPNSQSPFQRFTFADGQEPYIFCPLGEDFRAYVRDAIRHIASLGPDFLLVDDDTRMVTGRGGCYCPLHVAAFNAKAGTSHDRESLRRAVEADPGAARLFNEVQKESIVSLARLIRDAIDEAAPGLPCGYCACACDTEHALAAATALAAPGQRPLLRINNGRYLRESLRDIPVWAMSTALQIQSVPQGWDVLDEPDTCPQNRYSTSAATMHSHIALALLEGATGAKLWITRTGAWEPGSGSAYRRMLTENLGFYRALASMRVEWDGVRLPFPAPLPHPSLPIPESHPDLVGLVFGRMGIPVCFGGPDKGPVFLGEGQARALSEERLRALLSTGSALLDGPGAITLCERGLAPLLGLRSAFPWGDRPSVSGERMAEGGVIHISPDVATAALAPLPGTEILSTLFHQPSAQSDVREDLTPALVFHRGPEGGRVAVLAAASLRPGGFSPFCWLNEKRKGQFLRLLQLLGPLPCWTPGDDEIYLKTGIADGFRVLVLTDLSLDDVETPRVAGLPSPPASLERLAPDGSWERVEAAWDERRHELLLPFPLRPLRPAVLRIPHPPTDFAFLA